MRPSRVPDLDADDALAEHALLHDPVERREGRWIRPQHAVAQRGLDDALAGEDGELACVPERLAAAEVPEDEQRADEEQREHEKAR